MTKNTNINTLFKTLADTLPYEYTETLTDNGTTIVITKEDSDRTMYISPDETNADDFVVAIIYDDQAKGYYEEYETFHRASKDDQLPLDTILTDIKHYL